MFINSYGYLWGLYCFIFNIAFMVPIIPWPQCFFFTEWGISPKSLSALNEPLLWKSQLIWISIGIQSVLKYRSFRGKKGQENLWMWSKESPQVSKPECDIDSKIKDYESARSSYSKTTHTQQSLMSGVSLTLVLALYLLHRRFCLLTIFQKWNRLLRRASSML